MDQTKEVYTIADRSYRLMVDLEKKELFEEAVRQIELQMKEYAGMYAYKDKQDLLAMVALQYSVESIMLENSKKESESENLLEGKLLDIEETLDEVL